MLRELSVRRLAVIEDLRVSFGSGLNVLTGETGAGKSILVNAIGLALGWRATSDIIRTDCDDAEVDALFDVEDEPTRQTLTQLNASEQDEVLVRRVIQAAGRNRVLLNDATITLTSLRDLGETLLNLYSQHEAQGLIRPEFHRDVLDDYAGLQPARTEVAASVARYRELAAEQKDLHKREAERAARAGYLRFVVEEIDAAGIEESEDEKLTVERRVLANAETLAHLARNISEVLYDREENAVAEDAGELLRRVEGKLELDPSLGEMAEGLRGLVATAEDVAARARDYADSLEHDPARLESVEERLNALRELKKKYGGSLVAISQTRDDAEAELGSLEKLTGRIAEVDKQLQAEGEALLAAAKKLTAARKKAAKKMTAEVAGELADLDMPGTELVVDFASLTAGVELGNLRIDETGADQVELLISPNVGEAPRPLARIASGGELSRIMLAIKRVLSRHFPVPTLIFDEIDAGVGGAQAERLGRKLREVAADHQVLCITHLPQIAALADRHYVVSKLIRDGRTHTEVTLLDEAGRVEELARMLGGAKVTEAARAAARALLESGAA